MAESVLYEASVVASGGREGQVESDDGRLDLQLSVPRALGGTDGPGTNPEQLFAAGYSACFLSALKLVARQSKFKLPEDVAVEAKVGVAPDTVGYRLVVSLMIDLPGFDASQALRLVGEAHERCPYSRAVRNNLDVELKLRR